MTDTNNQGTNEAAAPGPQPALRIMAQYTKDLSFENPNAPQSLAEGKAPEIGVAINVNARPLGGNDFEVELKLEAKGSHGDKAAFMVELAYAGIFRIENMPQDVMQPLMLIECPRLLFPFARQILSDATRNGGFPPLMLEPIDFGQIYQRRLQAAEFRHALAAAIGQLPEREQLVLSLYYEQEMNLREVGAVLGVSESRVCQIHGQAMLRLRSRLGEFGSADNDTEDVG